MLLLYSMETFFFSQLLCCTVMKCNGEGMPKIHTLLRYINFILFLLCSEQSVASLILFPDFFRSFSLQFFLVNITKWKGGRLQFFIFHTNININMGTRATKAYRFLLYIWDKKKFFTHHLQFFLWLSLFNTFWVFSWFSGKGNMLVNKLELIF